MDFVGATLPQLDHLLEGMRLTPYGPGVTGSLFQWSRCTLDGVRVTEVWQSHNHFEFFFREEIEPRLSETGLREPETTTYEVHSYLTQGPTPLSRPEETWIGTLSFEEKAVGRYTLRSKEDVVEKNKSIDSPAQHGLFLATDDARMVVDFAVGTPGVGPVMDVDSGDFFPSAPDADLDSNRTGESDSGV